MTPTNLAEEKEKFFASDTYNPQLKYDWNTDKLSKWLEKTPEYKSFVEAVLRQNHNEIVTQGELVFSTKLDQEKLALAREITSQPPKSLLTPPTDVIVKAFEVAMEKLEIDYAMEVSDQHGFNFRPDHKNRKIVMSRHANLQYYSVDGEVKHELVHVIRRLNGKHNKISVSRNYLPTEEGLATYFQDYIGEESASAAFQHAAEYVLTDHALQYSLRSCVDFWESLGFNRELAWQRSIRHKFGFQDTSLHGDNMKPSMYFFWEQEIRKLNDSEKLRLFNGKIRLDELSQYESYSGAIDKDILCVFYKLSV